MKKILKLSKKTVTKPAAAFKAPEKEAEKVTISGWVDVSVFDYIQKLKAKEERSQSFIIAKMLKGYAEANPLTKK